MINTPRHRPLPSAAPSPLDGALPDAPFCERHERVVPVPPAVAAHAVRHLTGAEIRLLGPLMALRELRLRDRRRPARTFLEELPDLGFEAYRDDGAVVVFGTVSQPWKLRGEERRVGSLEGLAAFGEPGFCRIAATIEVQPAPGGSRLVTETRVGPTDDGALRSFGRYWTVIRASSSILRRSMLAAIDRRSRRGGGAPPPPRPTTGTRALGGLFLVAAAVNAVVTVPDAERVLGSFADTAWSVPASWFVEQAVVPVARAVALAVVALEAGLGVWFLRRPTAAPHLVAAAFVLSLVAVLSWPYLVVNLALGSALLVAGWRRLA